MKVSSQKRCRIGANIFTFINKQKTVSLKVLKFSQVVKVFVITIPDNVWLSFF